MTTPPSWTQTVIWYAVYPLGATGAPIFSADPESEPHRLRHLLDWLDHLVELGCNGLLLGPIFASRTHGYDTLDYFTIDRRLGTDADFDELVGACRQRGIRILLDGVFNHVSAEFPALLEALADQQAPSSDWFHIDYSTQPPTRLNFEGSDDLVRLNHDSQAVVELVTEVMTHWLARGVDGWRLDAAYAVKPEFWVKVLPKVREQYPDALFVGEVIHADLDEVSRSTVDSITAYELWKAIWSSIKDVNWFELDWTISRHNELLERVRPLTFLSNHDVTRIASQIGPQGALVAAAVLATVGGMPAIYYLDEGGEPGTKYERAGGDEEIRPALPGNPSEWVAPEPWLYDRYRELLGLRRRHPWLVDARYEKVELTNAHLIYRTTRDDQWLQVDLELGERHRVRISGPDGELFNWP